MKITKNTQYITNGKAIVQLGHFSAGKNKSFGSGSFWCCACWPANSMRWGFYANTLPVMWLVPQFEGDTPFHKGFIGINKSLIPAKILKKLAA